MVPVGLRAVQRWTGLGELQGGPGTQLSALRRGSFPLLPLGEAELEDLGDASGAEPPLPGAETCLGWAPSLGAGWECPGATIPVSDVPVLGAARVPGAHWLLGLRSWLWRVLEPPSRLLGSRLAQVHLQVVGDPPDGRALGGGDVAQRPAAHLGSAPSSALLAKAGHPTAQSLSPIWGLRGRD